MTKEMIEMLGEDNEEPPSKEKLSTKMDLNGCYRCHFGFIYLSSVLLCRGNIQSRRMVWETLGNNVYPDSL
jgi:hypothetical protein